jgi:hypothetical protein
MKIELLFFSLKLNNLTVTSFSRIASSSGIRKASYWSTKHEASVTYAAIVSSDHHCAKLPYLSLCRPVKNKNKN